MQQISDKTLYELVTLKLLWDFHVTQDSEKTMVFGSETGKRILVFSS